MREMIRPSDVRRSNTAITVVREMSSSFASVRLDGSRLPAGRSPEVISWRIAP